MKQFITADTIANEIRMAGDGYRGVFIMVEGETDRALYHYFFHEEKCRFILSTGKPKAISAMRKLKGQRNVIAILDADFSRITGKDLPDMENVFLTDTHDSETLIIRSKAFSKTLNNYCDMGKLELFLKTRDLREVLLLSAQKIGLLRLANEKLRRSIRFNCLEFEKFTDPDTLEINLTALVGQLVEQSDDEVPVKDLEEQIRIFIQEKHDPWMVVCGHDVVRILVVGLKNRLGFGRPYHPTDIETGLRQAFETGHFRETKLYQLIKDWSERVLGHEILAC
jgi:hypothetical protein